MNQTKCRRIVAERSGGICEGCGVRRATNMSHRLAASQGGKWEPVNVLHLCGNGNHNDGSCHGAVEHHAEAARILGWRLRPGDDPSSTPTVMRGRLALLGNDGASVISTAVSQSVPTVPQDYPK